MRQWPMKNRSSGSDYWADRVLGAEIEKEGERGERERGERERGRVS